MHLLLFSNRFYLQESVIEAYLVVRDAIFRV